MDSILEQQRLHHEEIERLVRGASDLGNLNFPTQRLSVNAQHHTRAMLERASECASKLLAAYDDADGLRSAELALMSGAPTESFYNKLSAIKAFHTKYPNEIARPMDIDLIPEGLSEMAKKASVATNGSFSGEEGYGKYLDLVALHEAYINLNMGERIEYTQYLQMFDQLYELDNKKKGSNAYKRYVDDLLSYLQDFFERAFPLRNYAEVSGRAAWALTDFEQKWAQGEFVGWQGYQAPSAVPVAALDLSPYASVEALEAVDPERVKAGLMALGLKAGGTPRQRAERLFATKGKRLEDLDKSFFAKKKKGENADSATAGTTRSGDKAKEVAKMEAEIYRLCELLEDVRSATLENVQRKQARTADEIEEEDDDIVVLEDEEEDDEDIPSAQRTNVVMDWEGKPIPYWLYRLHGLSKVYICEICGNEPYRGPKAFQQHFSEWRHAHGMRCLGIPNSKHFINITKIQDAKNLYERLKSNKDTSFFDKDEEEFEDSMGNVVTKKVYEDLARQGLL
ncbi:uncharacterized protein MONBRDRAFT_17466 [Monosiga brevicollis MX1]|uniref:Matrin-type domain-containing protein n=1 Tax=Monosiga brevicollis TaxID=81824 RepID=A9URU6_MONBE|nr:uncharacterized protein MONBRDRAFT_17466 [Monosiga brevicollis MX1]EDQ91987.1 predicted protein [Monosiga brevicollis MX1]|eukprot:XP_001743273.1 hypothetical protein [Monosiga brevicollis MX1]